MNGSRSLASLRVLRLVATHNQAREGSAAIAYRAAWLSSPAVWLPENSTASAGSAPPS